MSGHTPGPWALMPQAGDADQHRITHEVRATSREAFNQPGYWGDYHGCTLALVVCHPSLLEEGDREERDRHEANARLIAAAPDLLVALEVLTEVSRGWVDPDGSPNPQVEAANRMARAALKKARS